MSEWDVRLSQTARRDIVDVVGYIENVLKNSSAADTLIDSFVKQTDNLKRFPEFAPLVAESRLAQKGIRYFPVKNYVVFYDIDEIQHVVNILRFLHGTRDWQLLL